MAASTVNEFVGSGTAAEMAAYVPDPPVTVNPPDCGFVYFNTTDGLLYAWDGAAWVPAGGGGSAQPRVVGVNVDGGGSVIPTGQKRYIQCPISGTVTSWTILADQSGNVEFDVTLNPFGSPYPPTTSIVGAAPPELVAADSAMDSTLTGWSPAVTAGDVFGFEVISAATIEWVMLQLTVTP